MESYNKYSVQYPQFEFHKYIFDVHDSGLTGEFTYHIYDNNQEVAFELKTGFSIEYINSSVSVDQDLDTMIFHLGLVEAISYWKMTCAPQFKISCGKLNSSQISWWRKLYKKGLSEFFYLNEITQWDENNLNIEVANLPKPNPKQREYSDCKVMIPVGGGKDSIATMELLLSKKEDIVPIVMNPIQASLDLIKHHNIDSFIKITRKLDPQIIAMNKLGFLNGHIPFSAVLSFYTMLAARMYGIKHIALSNESSANEPTILGTDINHQYSKSLEYELDINEYAANYMDKDINYFSLLRPFNEYQITKIFSKVDKNIFNIFLSCNVGSKVGKWCMKCPKCLFTYIMIHAHLPIVDMVNIYGHDLLDDESLQGYFLSLTGQRTEKPFECVGTIEEVNAALSEIKAKRINDLPKLFSYWSEDLVLRSSEELLHERNPSNLNEEFSLLIDKAMSDVIE